MPRAAPSGREDAAGGHQTRSWRPPSPYSPMCRRHDSRPGLHDDAFHPLSGTRGPRWGTPARRTRAHRTGPPAPGHHAGRTES